ncbi:MAG TPA: hypothetical protein DCY13_01390 [Verrucomicrobiales bacterium]|nr:hypothetical protein [Verrucomicrobiales bacterium]
MQFILAFTRRVLYGICVSKKRPRSGEKIYSATLIDRWNPAYWRTRIRKSTYTYRGETRETSHWHVKFQVNGKRRTVTLSSLDLDAAAVEARNAYRQAVTGVSSAGTQPASEGEPDDATRMSAAHWRRRLLRRKYLELLRQGQATEWSVVIDHDAARRLFPLGTMNPDEAAMRAAERFQTVALQGWRQANLQYEQEFTIALFWNENPMVCTYTTLLTIPASLASELPDGGQVQCAVIEPDEGVRRALRRWLCCQPGMPLRVVPVEAGSLEAYLKKEQPALILANLSQSGESGVELVARLKELAPNTPAYTFGIFEDSDGIFASMSGISGGYMLRRRPPDRLLDPIFGAALKSFTPDRALRLVRRYFQHLLEAGEEPAEPSVEPSLTIREHEVMVYMAQGLQDKEIANKLDISTWTVHSHVRRIFQKFEVHGRTEAVVKFLEMEKIF